MTCAATGSYACRLEWNESLARRRQPLMTEAHFTGGVARTERACFDLSTESRVLRAADDPAAEWDPHAVIWKNF